MKLQVSVWWPRFALMGALCAASSLASPPSARAESAPQRCSRWPAVFPTNLNSLPRNAPALVFLPGTGWFDGGVEDYMLTLREPDGNVVPATLEREGEHTLIRPGRALRGIEVVVRYRDLCSYYAASPEIAHQVRLDPESPLPTTLGTLQPPAAATRVGGGYPNPVCTSPAAEKVSLGVVLEQSAALAAFVGVSRFEVTFAGQTKHFDYGHFSGQGKVITLPVDATCAPGAKTVGGQVTVKAHVAGATSDPPALSVVVNANCPVPNPKDPPCPDIDAGQAVDPTRPPEIVDAAATRAESGSSADAGAPATLPSGPADAGAAPSSAMPKPSLGNDVGDGDSGGCSMTGTAAPSGLAGVALLALLLARRRRSP